MENLDLNALRIAEFIALGHEINEILSRNLPLSPGLQEAALAFKNGFNQVSLAYARERGRPLSREIEELDFRRDECINGIMQLAEAFSRHYDEAMRTAAGKLLQVIRQYGSNIALQNYNAETSSLKSIIEDLEATGPAREAMVKLGLTEWVAEMKTANDRFANVYSEQTQDTGEHPVGNLKELRGFARANYLDLLGMLDAQKWVKTDATLLTLVNEINEVIVRYHEMVASRKIFGGIEDVPIPAL